MLSKENIQMYGIHSGMDSYFQKWIPECIPVSNTGMRNGIFRNIIGIGMDLHYILVLVGCTVNYDKQDTLDLKCVAKSPLQKKS